MNTILSALFAGKAALLGNQIQFIYEPYDSASSNCTHQLASTANPYDHEVTCIDSNKIKHSFVVHLALSKYTHPTPPRISYELLYWVNDNGATTWFHLEKESNLMMLESSQSLIGEPSGLRLKINLQK